MRIAVTDANIFIDLIYIDLINELFILNFEVFTTHEVLEELKSSEQDTIIKFQKDKRLKIETANLEDKGEIIIPSSKLSCSDISVINLAANLKAGILSGDRLLRRIAIENNFEVHGILWVMDTMVNLKIISPSIACEKLEALLKFNKRMPSDESQEKIKSWKLKS